MLYFGKPVRRVKIKETIKNITRYYTLNRPITGLEIATDMVADVTKIFSLVKILV